MAIAAMGCVVSVPASGAAAGLLPSTPVLSSSIPSQSYADVAASSQGSSLSLSLPGSYLNPILWFLLLLKIFEMY